MQFLTPAMLALAAIAAPIIILYMLRLRRREITVSSTMLWQKLMQDREANAPWQKLRRNLLLLLQLLILAALVIALARPFIPVPTVAAGSVALLIDASASMNTIDQPGGASRLEAAQAAARDLANELSSDQVMTVIAVGAVPQVLTPPTNDRAALREAINRAEPTAAVADWEAALALGAASIAGHDEMAVVVLSDGGLPENLPSLPAEVRYVRIGRDTENLAISALATRASDEQPELFAAVTNYGAEAADVILSIEVDGTIHTAERLAVPAGDTTELTITDLPDDINLIRAELTEPVEGGIEDRMPTDDVAYAVYNPPISGRVLLVTEGNLFLEQIFSAIPNVEAFKVTPGPLSDADDYDLVILDGWLPETLPDTNLLIVAPPSSSSLFVVGETFEETAFLRAVDDPVLSFVDFTDVAIREAISVETPGWGQPMIEAQGGPLLIMGQTAGRRVAILTFDLHASNLPLKLSFPILIANLMEWYAPARPFDAPAALRSGDPVTIRPQGSTTAYRVTTPDGDSQTYQLGESAPTFVGTDQLGIYQVELLTGDTVTQTGHFSVNLFSKDESTIAPREGITVGTEQVGQGADDKNYGEREFWPWLAGLALLVLVIEWWVYHRGTMLPTTNPTKPRGLFARFRRSP